MQVVDQFKKIYPKYKNKKIAYAGRLDPLAHGVLLLLVEPETKNAKKYQNLDKEYKFEVLLGVETDSFDILGRLKNRGTKEPRNIGVRELRGFAKGYVGHFSQLYPPFSSKTVKGKPLFWWAREGKLKDIKLPSKKVEIYDLKLIKTYKIDVNSLSNQVTKKLKTIKGNFRQKKIMKDWKNFFKTTKQNEFQIAKFNIHCSSGTYVRQIAHEMGQKIGIGAIAFDILRTRVGEYKLEKSLRL